jgi:hypothetical protein
MKCTFSKRRKYYFSAEVASLLFFSEREKTDHSVHVLFFRGAVVNKRDDPDHFINRGLDYYPICAEDTVPYLGWLLRGLLLRNHPRLPEVVDRIVNRYLRVTDEPGEPADKVPISLIIKYLL